MNHKTDDLMFEIAKFQQVVEQHDGHPNLVTTSDVERARQDLYDFVTKCETKEMDDLRAEKVKLSDSLAEEQKLAQAAVDQAEEFKAQLDEEHKRAYAAGYNNGAEARDAYAEQLKAELAERAFAHQAACDEVQRLQRALADQEPQCPKAGELDSKSDCARFDSSGVRQSTPARGSKPDYSDEAIHEAANWLGMSEADLRGVLKITAGPPGVFHTTACDCCGHRSAYAKPGTACVTTRHPPCPGRMRDVTLPPNCQEAKS